MRHLPCALATIAWRLLRFLQLRLSEVPAHPSPDVLRGFYFLTAMRELLRAAATKRIAASALRISLAVGTVLNLINQGGAILDGADISWFHALLNYLVPYCVASYSAAKNQVSREQEPSS